MSISLNRAFYRSMAEEFAGNFTSDQLVELVQILRADIDIKNKTSFRPMYHKTKVKTNRTPILIITMSFWVTLLIKIK